MRRPKHWLIALMLIFTSSAPALASTIGLSTWYEFGFDPNHSPLAAGCQPADSAGVPCRLGIGSTFLGSSPWTISTESLVEMTVTDAFLAGDFFDVFDFGVLISSTPSVAVNGANCGFDPSICVAATGFSHASFVLPAGAHSITVGVHEAQILGEGFFRLDTVPEPSTFGVMTLLALAIWLGRRRLAL
jgi:PEP-CTERM motif